MNKNKWWLLLGVVGLLIALYVFWPKLRRDEADPQVVELKNEVAYYKERERVWKDSASVLSALLSEQKRKTKEIENQRQGLLRYYRDYRADELEGLLTAAADSLRKQREAVGK